MQTTIIAINCLMMGYVWSALKSGVKSLETYDMQLTLLIINKKNHEFICLDHFILVLCDLKYLLVYSLQYFKYKHFYLKKSLQQVFSFFFFQMVKIN